MAPFLDDMSSPAPETSTRPAPGPAAGGDELDDLFDYDVGIDEVFRDLEPRKPASPKDSTWRGRADLGLGIDKEIEVIKKARAPRVKLDENRLLSQAGIPRLRKRAKDLKFKGKGHEYSDAARLLSFYQLWLDDLFPKAKFLDAAAMIEKLGHKKRIQMMRMDWINEGKPQAPVTEDSIFDEPMLPPREVPDRINAPPRVAPIFEKSQTERPKTPDVNRDGDEDLYDATPRTSRPQLSESADLVPANESLFGPRKTAIPDEPEDDLDALLAEQEMEGVSVGQRVDAASQARGITAPEPDFDDEMEAMAEMGDMYDY